jgi:hypothetical protein
MRVGILELLAYPARLGWEGVECFWANKQFASITPQVISVWCRRMGHTTFYTTYYGWGDPMARLARELDFLFVSAPTNLAPLAYALCKAYQKLGVITIIGGPHAKSFPFDCQRYFDYVVLDCDQTLITGILKREFQPKSILSSQKPYSELPSLEERLPEIRSSVFLRGRSFSGSFVPMLASMGCPYQCDFCIDWNNPYQLLSKSRLQADLRFAADKLPGAGLAFHDPNFGVRLDEILSILESCPPGRRNPYGIQSTLSNLHIDRLKRLHDTRCVFLLSSIESWTARYSRKSGLEKISPQVKLEKACEQFELLNKYVPYLITNLIFINKAPYVWTNLHIPIPFGNTPLFQNLLKEGRILKRLPFPFYRVPYLTIILKNYEPIEYFKNMTELYQLVCSFKLLKKRIEANANYQIATTYILRTMAARYRYHAFQKNLERLRNDAEFLAFHRGKTEVLPQYYAYTYRRLLGKYSELAPLEENCDPIFDQPSGAGTLPKSLLPDSQLDDH